MENEPIASLISLKGRRALVTGAAAGIGRAISHRFAEAGASLVLVDIDSRGLKRVKNELAEYGGKVEIRKVDLSNKENVVKLWDSLKDEDVDILVNNAGIYLFRDFLEVDDEFIDKTLEINLKSVFWMCQEMIRRNLKRGGVIINVASIEAVLPFAKGLVHYDVSKMGVIALTRALAREYGRKFRVNAIIPGGIETKGVKKLKKEAAMKLNMDMIKTAINFKSRLPIGRFGKPDEVARAVLFLAGEMASYINGAMLAVDGGFLSA